MLAVCEAEGKSGFRREPHYEETAMSWNTPVVIEVCAGMEVTAYLSAEI